MPFFQRLVCCQTDENVYESDDSSSSSGEDLGAGRIGDAAAAVIHWPQPPSDHLLSRDAGSIRVLPSGTRRTPTTSSRSRHRKSESAVLSSKPPSRLPGQGTEDGEEEGWGERPRALGEAIEGRATSLKSVFTPQPSALQKKLDAKNKKFFDEDNDAGDEDGDESDRTALNLAFKETRRLPDVAGEDRVAWAAGVLRIDLTETGIRTLRGLDAFPNVQALVLDGNGLLSLPMDCPWCPAIEALWLCNNEIENLDGILFQINDVFPRLKSLALMGNPVWAAAKPRPGPEGDEEDQDKEQEVDGVEEAAYRLQVVMRLPGLVTLDCVDVTEAERSRAKSLNERVQLDDIDLQLEAEPTTDVEESLPRDTPPGSTKSVASVSHGVGKFLEADRDRRANLPDRGSLPSTWNKDAVVMDVGSGWARMGLAGREKPSSVFPSIVGRVDLRAYDRIAGQEERVYVGHRAVEEANKRAAERELPDGNGPMPSPILLQHPLSSGMVTDWDDMEELWRYGIEDQLGLDAIEHPVLMADSTATDSSEREKATEVLLETLATPAVHMALQPVLALYACGPTSGLVVDVGESGTQVAPIFDGFVVEQGIRWIGLGGKDITRHLGALVNAKVGLMGGDDFETDNPCDMLKLEELKAKMCFVSEDVDRDNAKMELSMSKSYTLPDGTPITLGRERYRAAEVLFEPAMQLREEASLQDAVLDSILACERKTWKVLAQTIILTGGTTELTGLNRRLQKELTKTSRANGVRLKYTVMAPEDDHNNTVWVGGSLLASTGALDDLWFTRAEYEEYGAGYIHSKFAA
eukprot:g15098.t1